MLPIVKPKKSNYLRLFLFGNNSDVILHYLILGFNVYSRMIFDLYIYIYIYIN